MVESRASNPTEVWLSDGSSKRSEDALPSRQYIDRKPGDGRLFAACFISAFVSSQAEILAGLEIGVHFPANLEGW